MEGKLGQAQFLVLEEPSDRRHFAPVLGVDPWPFLS